MRHFLMVMLLGLALAGPIARAQNVPVDMRGIYVDSNAFPLSAENEAALSDSLNVPGVDGLVLVLGWKNIEPAMGQYDWSTLDQWMGMAISLGKKVDLSLRAGNLTPAWLFQPAPAGDGATPLSFSYPDKGACESETIAAAWDPAFLAQWDAMLAAVSAHLKSTGAYNAVTLLRLTGINRDTDELHLPSQTNQVVDGCPGDAITATWMQVGYRPSLLLSGWNAITDSFKKSFPDKSFSVALIDVTNPFPPIAEDGSIINGMSPGDLSSAQNLPLMTAASQKFPGHLVIQNNSLYITEPAEPETINFAETLGTMLAFQTNEEGHREAACGGRGETTPCTDTTFLEMLRTGIYPLGSSNPLRAEYIEVFAANVNAFPDDILQAHHELAPDTLTLELAKEKPNGKLVVYITSTDRKATLTITALPLNGQLPIDLGAMTKTDPNGNEFFVVKKHLPTIASVEIASTSGGFITAPVK